MDAQRPRLGDGAVVWFEVVYRLRLLPVEEVDRPEHLDVPLVQILVISHGQLNVRLHAQALDLVPLRGEPATHGEVQRPASCRVATVLQLLELVLQQALL